eukprot:scaffold2185_cov160-Alexandrium_tamarense.AAC.7
MVQLNSSDIAWGREECVGASVGWGHSALLIRGKKSSNSNNTTRLMVCGRPHDFQTLMRLRRLPPFIRNFASKRSEATKDPRILQRIASFLAGSNEVTFNEEEHRRNSNIQSLLEIPLPNGDEQAVEGEEIGEEGRVEREERIQDEGENENGGQSTQQRQPVHTRFQNTLADGSVYAVGVATDQPVPSGTRL